MKTNQTKNQISSYENAPLTKFLWLKNNFAYCLAIVSLAWIVGLCYYIDYFIGWVSILNLAPADFGSFIFFSTVPLFLFWFVLAYINRSSSLNENTRVFSTYIDSLLYPDDDASQNAKAISAALHKQIAELHKESAKAVAQSAQVKLDLDARIADLAKIVQSLDEYSSQTLSMLNDGVKSLADRCSFVTNKTVSTIGRLEDGTQKIMQTSDKFLGKMGPLIDEVSAISLNIKNNISNNGTVLVDIKKQLNECVNISQLTTQELFSKIEKNKAHLEQSFYKITEEYDTLYKKLDRSISGVEGFVEEQKRLINTQSKVLNNNSELLNTKLMKYGKTISQEIDKLVKTSMDLEHLTKKQISAFKTVNAVTNKASQSIASTFDAKKTELDSRCEYAVNSMQNVMLALNKETDKLTALTTLTQAKNLDLQNITETMVDKIGDISSKLALKTDTLKDKAVEVIGKFTEASDIINHSTEKLNASSNLIVNNGQKGMKLLEEQDFHITNTLSNIEMLQEKLDKLKFDIQKSATAITNSLNDYEKQLNRYETYQKVEIEEPELDKDTLTLAANNIKTTLEKMHVYPDKLYENLDMFDLWSSYLSGNNVAFTEVLKEKLLHKQIASIRKSFDDNSTFHNSVINYLFLMDNFIKKVVNTTMGDQNELINFSVRTSLDKLYFILIKALNQ